MINREEIKREIRSIESRIDEVLNEGCDASGGTKLSAFEESRKLHERKDALEAMLDSPGLFPS